MKTRIFFTFLLFTIAAVLGIAILAAIKQATPTTHDLKGTDYIHKSPLPITKPGFKE